MDAVTRCIPIDISDLFFNTDVEVAACFDKDGIFTGYNPETLRTETEVFCDTFERATGIHVDVDDLVSDFLGRV